MVAHIHDGCIISIVSPFAICFNNFPVQCIYYYYALYYYWELFVGGEGGCVYWMNIISLLCLYLFCCTLFSHTADCTVIQIMELSTIIIMYQPTLQKPCCVVCAIYNHTELKPRFSMLTNTSMLLNWLAKVTSLELSTLPSIAFRWVLCGSSLLYYLQISRDSQLYTHYV